MRSLKFTKMHGLGNDFIVVDCINQRVNLSAEDVFFLADRHLGIGCDQLLLVELADHEDVDFCYRIFNADGSEVEQCGNGARCFARFVREKGLTDKDEVVVNTQGGRIVLHIMPDNNVRVDMGRPVFQPDLIPIVSPRKKTVYNQIIKVNKEEYSIDFVAVSMGNPHAVVVVDDIEAADVSGIGSQLAQQPFFSQGVNVGFMQVINRENIRLRVFERGAGETQACGTGACAAMVAGKLLGLLASEVAVSLLGGKLTIQWAGDEHTVLMTGPTETVFEGSINL